jgi:DNA polymerase III delta prime subunit
MTHLFFDCDPPSNFPAHIHQALKSWHRQHVDGVLDTFLLARQVRAKRDTASLRLVTNQILIEGLDRLKCVNPEAFDLLQRRFLNRETAREIAYRFNVGEDVIYQRQRAAIEQLSEVIWQQETELRRQRAQHIMNHLEPPTYTKLFGVTEAISQIREKLENRTPPWILALEGMGGIGKTSFADALARELAYSTHFQNIAWVSVRQRFFRLSGAIETLPKVPNLTLAMLVDQLIDQFALIELKRQAGTEKLIGVKTYLKAHPNLMILDNFETVDDYHALVIQLREFINPSKFLITTRYSLRGESDVYIAPLQGLSFEDTVRLVRYEAETQGLLELATAPEVMLEPIYALTYGNPLAIKLVVGQVHTFALSAVLERLRGIADRPTTELLNFLYADAWHILDEKQRQVLKAMLLTPDCGGHIEQITAAAGLDMGETVSCLHRLATLSLVNVIGGLNERLYMLHHLTRTFVAYQSHAEL